MTVIDNNTGAHNTLLAWRRSALQLGVAAVFAARGLANHVGPAVLVVALAAVALAIAVHASASRAYARHVDNDGTVSESGLSRIESPHTRLGLVAGASVAVGILAFAWILSVAE